MNTTVNLAGVGIEESGYDGFRGFRLEGKSTASL